MTQDIFHAIQRCADARTLRETLFAYFGEQGFGRIGFGAPSRSNPGALTIVERGYPAEMLGRYQDGRHHLHDPALNRALASGRPLRWRDVLRQGDLSQGERAVIGGLLDSEATDGIAIPTFGRSNSAGIVNLSSSNAAEVVAAADLPRLQAVAQQAHLRLDKLLYDSDPAPELSPRERQILFWIAQHKSNTDIGTILAISPTTIATHVKRAFEKLDANDRMSAVNRAIESGQIWV